MLNLTSPIDPAGRELSGAAGIFLKTHRIINFHEFFVTLCFSGFAIDRSKKYINVIKNHVKTDAVDPQAAADNPPASPDHNG